MMIASYVVMPVSFVLSATKSRHPDRSRAQRGGAEGPVFVGASTRIGPSAPLGMTVQIRSDRAHFRKPFDRELVIPADGGFPGGRGLRGDVMRGGVQAGGVVR